MWIGVVEVVVVDCCVVVVLAEAKLIAVADMGDGYVSIPYALAQC